MNYRATKVQAFVIVRSLNIELNISKQGSQHQFNQ
jgi:hypothetical protein